MGIRERIQLKKSLIKDILERTARPVKIEGSKQQFRYNEDDLEEYKKELERLKIKDLEILTVELKKAKEGILKKDLVKSKFTVADKISKIKRRKAILVRIFHKNKTSTDYVASKHNRFVAINKQKYLLPPNHGTWDNKNQMYCYSFFEHNPFPIQYVDDIATTFPDAEFLENTLHFEFAQKMAKVAALNKKLDMNFIATVIVGIISIGCLILLILMAKQSGVLNI